MAIQNPLTHCARPGVEPGPDTAELPPMPLRHSGNSTIHPPLFLSFLRPYLWHMNVPRLRIKSELQLLAYATAARDLSLVFDLHHSSRQRWMPNPLGNPLSEARDRTQVLMDTSWVCKLLSHGRNSHK